MVKNKIHRLVASVLVTALFINTEAVSAAAWPPARTPVVARTVTFNEQALGMRWISDRRPRPFIAPGRLLHMLIIPLTMVGMYAQEGTAPTGTLTDSNPSAEAKTVISDLQQLAKTLKTDTRNYRNALGDAIKKNDQADRELMSRKGAMAKVFAARLQTLTRALEHLKKMKKQTSRAA